MKTEDYKRAVRSMNEVNEDDKAALVVILKPDGNLFVANCGDDIVDLYERFLNYAGNVFASMAGTVQVNKNN